MSKIKYGKYIEELCCVDCDYAGRYQSMGNLAPPMPLSVCPDCGSQLKPAVGRWRYTEKKRGWWRDYLIGFGSIETIYHGFEKREKTPPKPWHHSMVGTKRSKNVSDDCECRGCEISNSGHGYQPCHNREKLIHPPQEIL